MLDSFGPKRSRRPIALSVGMCASLLVGASVRAEAQKPPARPFAAFSNSAINLRDSVVELARAQIGRRYKTGGDSPEKGFDCSGLVQYVMQTLRLDLPRTASQQGTSGRAVARDTSRLLPGDVLTFGKSQAGVSHVGIYVGNGRYVHASTAAGKVIETSIDRPFSPLVKMWRGARRIVATDTVAARAAVATKSGG
jgi:cell wall-associated NlpC family hydrolase